MVADDLPLLGEPLPVELANSLYEGAETIDFLTTPAGARLWLTHVRAEPPLSPRLAADELEELRALRDAIRRVLVALARRHPIRAGDVAMINRAAAAAAYHAHLELDGRGRPRVTTQYAGGADGLRARLATEAIALIAGPDGRRIRQCEGPGCAMLFVRDHHRRRWCHASCGHRARQASYYRRVRARQGGTT